MDTSEKLDRARIVDCITKCNWIFVSSNFETKWLYNEYFDTITYPLYKWICRHKLVSERFGKLMLVTGYSNKVKIPQIRILNIDTDIKIPNNLKNIVLADNLYSKPESSLFKIIITNSNQFLELHTTYPTICRGMRKECIRPSIDLCIKLEQWCLNNVYELALDEHRLLHSFDSYNIKLITVQRMDHIWNFRQLDCILLILKTHIDSIYNDDKLFKIINKLNKKLDKLKSYLLKFDSLMKNHSITILIEYKNPIISKLAVTLEDILKQLTNKA